MVQNSQSISYILVVGIKLARCWDDFEVHVLIIIYILIGVSILLCGDIVVSKHITKKLFLSTQAMKRYKHAQEGLR